MKVHRIEISVQARNDMLEIYYIVTELQNPTAAENLIDKMEKEINSISTIPERYKTVDMEPWRSREIRNLRVKNFYDYKIYEERSMVAVIMVTYVGRNQDAALTCVVGSGI